MNFQKIVIIIAIIFLILMLTLIGYALYEAKYNKRWPPVQSQCPDYWEVQSADGSNVAGSSGPGGPSKCVNVKDLGKKTCEKTMDFDSSEWQGKPGLCRKYKWAKQCDLTWDGITNRQDACQ